MQQGLLRFRPRNCRAPAGVESFRVVPHGLHADLAIGLWSRRALARGTLTEGIPRDGAREFGHGDLSLEIPPHGDLAGRGPGCH